MFVFAGSFAPLATESIEEDLFLKRLVEPSDLLHLLRPTRRWLNRLYRTLRTGVHLAALGGLTFGCSWAEPQKAPTPERPPPVFIPGAIGQLPSTQVRLASGPIAIDGKLNEAAWKDAEVLYLTQQAPTPGGPTPYLTEVRVLISGDALVFGFICHDPEPKKIQTHTLKRDGVQDGDDTVTILLDSFGDKRTAYFFQINSAAARLDGLVAGPLNVSSDWDGIWDAHTAKTADGWSAEIWIPAQTLNFAGGNSRWGMQLDRFIVRDQTELRWASPDRDSSLFDMSRAGSLEMTTPLKQGRGFELAPYISGKKTRDFSQSTSHWLGTGGGEATWKISPQLSAIATVNTDFAETEVDTRQINVTPFPLYFPEKRTFFLEGANQYVFGLDLDTNFTFIPFFSRNIGLLDGYNIPLHGGVKLNGHVGPWSIALLDVQTRTTYVPQTVVDALGLPSAKVEGTNLFASRFAYDFDKHLRLGTMLTHGDPTAQSENLLGGVDGVWNTSTFLKKRNLQLGAWAATTQGDLPKGNREAWGFHIDYPNDLVKCLGGASNFGDGFSPLLGYLPRPATHQIDISCSYQPRPSPTGHFRSIRQSFYDVLYTRFADTKGRLESQQFIINPVHFMTNSGATFMAYVYIRHERLTSPFAIVPTVAYPVGTYDFERYGATFNTSPKRPIQFESETYFGGYYKGSMFHQRNALSWEPLQGKAEVQVVADNYFGHTPQGNFVEKLWQFKGALSWSPDLSVSTLVQYDNISFGLSSNTRLRWTFRPGDDFFVIWDRSWQRDAVHPGLNLAPSAEGLTAKIRWTFRL